MPIYESFEHARRKLRRLVMSSRKERVSECSSAPHIANSRLSRGKVLKCCIDSAVSRFGSCAARPAPAAQLRPTGGRVSAGSDHHTGDASFFSASLVAQQQEWMDANASVTASTGAAVPGADCGACPGRAQASPRF